MGNKADLHTSAYDDLVRVQSSMHPEAGPYLERYGNLVREYLKSELSPATTEEKES